MRPLPSRGDIVRCLLDAGRALHAREVASRCRVSEGSYPGLLELLDQLSFDGSIRRLPGTRFKAQPIEDRETATWEGLLTVNPRGFGFVNAVGQEDVYIAPDGIGGALHGDRVRVAVISRSSRGLEGRIERIIERRKPRVAGVLRRRGRSAWLEPDDARVRGPIVITAGAKNGRDGDAAVAVITTFPDFAGENPEAELVAVLGQPGDPNTEVAKILVREQIEEEHPEAALQEAEAIAARVQRLSGEGRVDLRNVPLPTIDPEDARDHDDAIWVERNGDGFRAWIAIADVSEYVTPGSALDEEAVARGCSIYLPDRAIPMLPAALSADLCSLLPEHDRLCLCVIAEFDKQGKVKSFDVVEGIMRSAAMLTYAGVARALGFDPEAARSPQADAMKRDLKVIDELARKLRRQRLRRGALDLDLPEAKVVLDERSGAPVDVIQSKSSDGMKRAYQMVEELMLLANELVARFLSKHRAPAIYRVHGAPDELKLERLATVAEQLGARVEIDQLLEPKGVAKFLASIADHPRRQVLNMLLLRSLKQAQYDIVNIGHFGLASDAYLHFTSPIRRYPDLDVHRIIKGILRGNKPDTATAAVEALRTAATTASARERAASDVEREIVDLYRAIYMQDEVGNVFEGVVTGIAGAGIFVNLQDPFVDVMVRLDSLGPDHYEISEDELSVVGVRSGDTIELGDRLEVEIEDVAILRRTVYGKRLPSDQVLDEFERSLGRRRGGAPAKGKAAPRERGGKPGKPKPKPGRAAPRGRPSGRRPERSGGIRKPGAGRRKR
jgi:ribonuclease R